MGGTERRVSVGIVVLFVAGAGTVHAVLAVFMMRFTLVRIALVGDVATCHHPLPPAPGAAESLGYQ